MVPSWVENAVARMQTPGVVARVLRALADGSLGFRRGRRVPHALPDAVPLHLGRPDARHALGDGDRRVSRVRARARRTVADARGRDALAHLAAAAVAYGVLVAVVDVAAGAPPVRSRRRRRGDPRAPSGGSRSRTCSSTSGRSRGTCMRSPPRRCRCSTRTSSIRPPGRSRARTTSSATCRCSRRCTLVTRNPVLGHQAALFLCFPLSALAMHVRRARVDDEHAARRSSPACCSASRRGGSRSSAHLQLHATMYLPVALVAAERVVRGGSRRAWLALVVATGAAGAVLRLPRAHRRARGGRDGARRRRRPRAGAACPRRRRGGRRCSRSSSRSRTSCWRRRARSVGSAAAAPSARVPRRQPPPHVHGALEPTVDGRLLVPRLVVHRARRGGVRRPLQRPGGRSGAGSCSSPLTGWVVSLGYARAWRRRRPTPLPLGWLAALVPGFGTFRAPVRLGLGVALAMPALAGPRHGCARAAARRPARRARSSRRAADRWPCRVSAGAGAAAGGARRGGAAGGLPLARHGAARARARGPRRLHRRRLPRGRVGRALGERLPVREHAALADPPERLQRVSAAELLLAHGDRAPGSPRTTLSRISWT